MSGKNILWRLLDGHPNIAAPAIHAQIGYALVSDDAARFFARNKPAIRRETYKYLPKFTLNSSSGRREIIGLEDYYNALYRFSGYGGLRAWSKGKSIFVNPTEGRNIRFPFEFDFREFESRLEKALFCDDSTFSEKELLEEICNAYLDSDPSFEDKERITTFVDTLPNGLDSVHDLLNKVDDAKVLVMTRDTVSLAYSNAKRIISYQDELDKSLLRRVMFTQNQFIKKAVSQGNGFRQLAANSPQVKGVDFSDLIKLTEKTMRDIAQFLEVEFDRVLVSPTVGGERIVDESIGMTGVINDEPAKNLSKLDLNLIRYMVARYGEGERIHGISLFLRAIGWRLRASTLFGYAKRFVRLLTA